MKDYLGHEGVLVEPPTPRQTIKEAFAAEIIRDGQGWIDMLEARNRLAHTYDEAARDAFLTEAHTAYVPLFENLRAWLAGRP